MLQLFFWEVPLKLGGKLESQLLFAKLEDLQKRRHLGMHFEKKNRSNLESRISGWKKWMEICTWYRWGSVHGWSQSRQRFCKSPRRWDPKKRLEKDEISREFFFKGIFFKKALGSTVTGVEVDRKSPQKMPTKCNRKTVFKFPCYIYILVVIFLHPHRVESIHPKFQNFKGGRLQLAFFLGEFFLLGSPRKHTPKTKQGFC